MQHKLKNISGSIVVIGSLNLASGATFTIFDTVTYETNYVADIQTSMGSSTGINKLWSDGSLEYYQDLVLKTQDDFYAFISTFLSDVYPKIVENRTIVKQSINLDSKADLSGSTFTGNLATPALAGLSISATTYYSGSTGVDSLFAKTVHSHTLNDVVGLQTQLSNKPDITGSTFTGNIIAPALYGIAMSATTLYSGSTLVDSLFARTVHSHVIGDVNGLQTQLNGKADLTGATFSGGVFAPAVSATTFYSGSTNLSTIIASFITGGTVQGNYLSIGGGTVTGNTSFSTNLSATTLYSGATLVDSLFARTVHSHVIGDVTGLQTHLNNKVDLSGATFTGKADLTGATFTGNVRVPVFTATTFYSGSTLVDSLFARTVHTHVISDVTGLQTQLNGKSDLTGATFTGNVRVPSLSGVSLSATTYYSGATLVDSLFARTVHTHVIADVTGLQTHLNNKVNLSGSTLTGDFFNTSSGFLQFATGTTVQRPAVGIIGMMRYNTTLNKFEVYESTGWREVGTHWGSTGTSISYTGSNVLIGGTVDVTPYKLQVTGNTILNGSVIISGNSSALVVASGSTAQRPSSVNGTIRYNSTNDVFEVYEKNAWVDLTNVQYIQFSLLGQINNSTAAFWYAKDETGVTGGYRSVDTGNGLSTNAIDPWLAPFNGRILGGVVFSKGLGVASGSPVGPYLYRAVVYNVGPNSSQTTGMTTMDFVFPSGTTVGAFSSSVSSYASTEYIVTSASTFTRGQNIGVVWNPISTGLPNAITVQEGTRLTLIVQKTL